MGNKGNKEVIPVNNNKVVMVVNNQVLEVHKEVVMEDNLGGIIPQEGRDIQEGLVIYLQKFNNGLML